MNREMLDKILGNHTKHVDAIFVYRGGVPLAYRFAPYIPDNPDSFFAYNQEIEKIYRYLEDIDVGKLYHYEVTIGKKNVYMFVYRVKDDTYIFVFLDTKDLELAGVVQDRIIKPLADYLIFS
ncbi:hypothetical protein [Persephonella sp.]|nr:hypothetical protein [Aquificota bacterium]